MPGICMRACDPAGPLSRQACGRGARKISQMQAGQAIGARMHGADWVAISINGNGNNAIARTDCDLGRGGRGLRACRRHGERGKAKHHRQEKGGNHARHSCRLIPIASRRKWTKARKRKGPVGDQPTEPCIKADGDQAVAWAFAMSFLIFRADSDSSSSLALARKASRPPR